MQLANTHVPGRHCASTAVSDLTRFHGVPLSEPMCFGLGEGLGIYYVGLPGMEPSRLMHARSLSFEETFFKRLGMDFRWDQHGDPLDAEKALVAALDAGLPALIQTDIYYLPYYNSKTHFAGHLIAVWGYDAEKRVFFVSDTERPELYEVPFDAMRRARYCSLPPFVMEGNLFAPASLRLPDDLGERAWDAARSNSKRLLEAEAPYEGVNALRTWEAELDQWVEFADWQWTARLAYQTIMKRGTGGGGFRLMYADFLREAARAVPLIAEEGLADEMQAVGEAWDRLALALRGLSEKEIPEMEAVRPALREVREREEAYHLRVVNL